MAKKDKVSTEQVEVTEQAGEVTEKAVETIIEEPIQHPAEYEQWVAQYKKVHIIECEDDNGVIQRMYVSEPNYNLKKTCILSLVKDPLSIIEVGEMILAACYRGGYDMRQDDDMKLAAAIEANELVQVKDTRLKKSLTNTGKF